MPVKAAAALASLRAAGAASPWWSEIAALTPLTMNEPKIETRTAAPTVTGSGRANHRTPITSTTPSGPTQIVAPRPIRRETGEKIDARDQDADR